MKPPVKSYRAVECNPHELSTIKEENNTPKSEKTVRRIGNRSVGNSMDLTSSNFIFYFPQPSRKNH
jgi:hypothetical protein